ncbi:MAG: FAD-dependent oxidoreductase [Planctomycetota bacterium]|nr:FAD-dependent oxidoreductase [Planctomycetota bacterium]
MTSSRCRILIVGAGLAGAATAFHLRKLGVADVILLEREPLPGMHASGRNAAIVRERMESAALSALAREGAAALRAGALAEYRASGGYLLGTGEEQAATRMPPATGRGAWCPADGTVDVAGLLQRYLAGQDVRYGVSFEGYESTPEGLRVLTSSGPILAAHVVNAAGPWAGEVGELALEARKRHLFVSAPDPAIDPAWPYLWDVRAEYYLRPESGGLLLCACDETPAAPGDYGEDPEVIEQLYAKLARFQPGFGDLRIARRWVGQRTFASDRLPVIGPDAREPRLFHVAALGGHGVTLSYAVGRLAAAMLTAGASGPQAFDPARATRSATSAAAPAGARSPA